MPTYLRKFSYLAVATPANISNIGYQVTLVTELARVQKSMDRLMTAYQEDLLLLDDLRRRMPELRKREQATQAELREAAKTLDILERHRIVRLLVKEVLAQPPRFAEQNPFGSMR